MKCKECKNEIEHNMNFCPYCGHKVINKKVNIKMGKKRVLILISLLIIPSGFLGYRFLEEKRIENSLSNPILYWDLSLENYKNVPSYYSNSNVTYYCVYFKISANKIDNAYFLEDKYDFGRILLTTSDFELNNHRAINNSLSECTSGYEKGIVNTYEFSILDGYFNYIAFLLSEENYLMDWEITYKDEIIAVFE